MRQFRLKYVLPLLVLMVSIFAVGSAFADAPVDSVPGSVAQSGTSGAVAPNTGTYNPEGGVLYDNGPLYNVPGSPARSRLQDSSLSMTIFGFGHQTASNNRVADDFVVPAGQTWTVNGAQFFAYQTGSTTTSTINNLTVRIWDGVPQEAGSNLVFGDTTTNRFASSVWDNGYRELESAPGDTSRPIMVSDATVSVVLPAGTYWIDWSTGGTLGSGPWAPAITINGQTTTGNGLQSLAGGAFAAAMDVGQQGFPFRILGTGGTGPTPTATATAGGPTATPTASPTPGSGNRFCSSTALPIPDANPTGATSTINVPSSATISDLNVVVTGTHSWVGDIVLNLSNGTTNVTFYDQPGVPASTFGCSGDNLPGVVADDEGVSGSFENSCQNATPAFIPGGSYTNNAPLSAFDGANTSGNWTLSAADLAAGDTGTITGWCVEFAGGAGPTATPTTPPTAPDINVTPAAFEETHSSPPQTTNDTMNVQNVGSGTLTWTITEDDSRPGKLMTAKGAYVYNGAVQNVSGLSGSGAPAGTIEHSPAIANGSLFITHSATQNITTGNSVSCNAGGLHTDNSYYRVYDLAGDFGITQTIEVDEVSFGVEQAVGATGSQPVTINLYTLVGPLNTANLTLIGSEAASVPDSASGTVYAVPVSPEVVVPAGSVLVVEVFTPNGQTTGNSFFIGSNADPETDPSYLRAADCGVAQPTATGAIGFPNMHIVMNVSAGIVGGGACTAPTDIPWLTVAPMNGSTSGGGSTPVTLTYNSASLATGTYTGTLCIASNDADEALVTVPITLNVGPPTAIDLSSFTSPMSGINPADLAAAGLLLLAGAVLVLRRK